jgi:hypothetical protein
MLPVYDSASWMKKKRTASIGKYTAYAYGQSTRQIKNKHTSKNSTNKLLSVHMLFRHFAHKLTKFGVFRNPNEKYLLKKIMIVHNKS